MKQLHFNYILGPESLAAVDGVSARPGALQTLLTLAKRADRAG